MSAALQQGDWFIAREILAIRSWSPDEAAGGKFPVASAVRDEEPEFVLDDSPAKIGVGVGEILDLLWRSKELNQPRIARVLGRDVGGLQRVPHVLRAGDAMKGISAGRKDVAHGRARFSEIRGITVGLHIKFG